MNEIPGGERRFLSTPIASAKIDALYDPVKVEDRVVALGLSLDGRFAAVGHLRSVAYVDPAAGAVVATLSTDFNLAEVAVAGDTVFYVSFAEGGGQMVRSIRSLGLQGGDFDTNQKGYAIRPAPGGAALLGLSGTMPAALARWPIVGNGLGSSTAEPSAVFPLACPAGAWVAARGDRIYSSCGAVFGSWGENAAYPPYVTTLPKPVVSVAAAGSYVAAIEPAAPYTTERSSLRVLRPEFLLTEGRIPLARFAYNGGTAAAYGRWVFPAPGGNRFYVLTESSDPSLTAAAFQLETIDLDEEVACEPALAGVR